MKKHMENLTVEITDGHQIMISQDDPYEKHPITILISPHQVDTLIKWLQEAKETIESTNKE